MTPEQLAEIRDWVGRASRNDDDPHPAFIASDLLAHIDAQSAELTRLRQQLAHYADGRPSLYRDPEGPTP